MISAFSLCLLILALSAVSSQTPASNEWDDIQHTPVSDRRTFKNPKPVKFLPLLKKHKKFGGWIPHHSFGKTEYVEVPITHEIPIRPIYKVHRYQGVEVKPVSPSISETIHTSSPETIIESQSFVPPSSDFEPSFSSSPSFLPPSSVYVYPPHDKPTLSTPITPPPSAPIFLSPPASLPSAPILPPLPPKPVFHFNPFPQSTIPFKLPPTPLQTISHFTPLSIARPLPPTSAPAPSVPVFSSFHVQPPTPIITRVPAPPLPAPVITPLPATVQPATVVTPIPASIQPAPAFTTGTVLSPPISPIISHISLPHSSHPPLTSLSPAPSPIPIFSSVSSLLPPALSSPLPSPAPVLSSVPISVTPTPEPEFPYPPSGTPIPSYIKDISLPDISVKDPPKVESLNFEEINADIDTNNIKNLEHALEPVKPENGLFQKIKDWKADKANAAWNHISNFKPKPIVHQQVSDKIPNVQSNNLPSYPAYQFPPTINSLPLTPDFRPPPVFFPSANIPAPIKYENFPPNHLGTQPQLFNSYGLPIPHDSYAPPLHASHDRVAPEASEEEPSILPPPSNFDEKKNVQDLKQQGSPNPEIQEVSQVLPEFQTKSLRQSQFQPEFLLNKQPIYVPENSKTESEDSQNVTETNPTNSNYQENHQVQKEEIVEEVNSNVQNHKDQ